jgi:hypothetical protein
MIYYESRDIRLPWISSTHSYNTYDTKK